MWLTRFDAPNLSTPYLDKPMKGHALMQAIARANRVYPGKTAGLIEYIDQTIQEADHFLLPLGINIGKIIESDNTPDQLDQLRDAYNTKKKKQTPIQPPFDNFPETFSSDSKIRLRKKSRTEKPNPNKTQNNKPAPYTKNRKNLFTHLKLSKKQNARVLPKPPPIAL